jgi:hypothetical protein
MFNFGKQKKEPESIEEILIQFKKLEADFGKISAELEALKKQSRFAIQKVGIVRFNPFREVGGDQSFSLALLNENEDGAVITSHYTRKENRIYGKPIKASTSEYPLSEEELEAIQIARTKKEESFLNQKKQKKEKDKKNNDQQ